MAAELKAWFEGTARALFVLLAVLTVLETLYA